MTKHSGSILHYSEPEFFCMSSDNSNVTITWFSLLAEPFSPSCPSKHLSISLTFWSWLHYLQGRLKVKSLRGVKSQSVSGKDLSRPSFFIRILSLSLSGLNYSPALVWTALTESETNMQCSLVWTCVIFAVDQEQKLFAMLFITRVLLFPPSPTFHLTFIFAKANTPFLAPWPSLVRLWACCVPLWKHTRKLPTLSDCAWNCLWNASIFRLIEMLSHSVDMSFPGGEEALKLIYQLCILSKKDWGVIWLELTTLGPLLD